MHNAKVIIIIIVITLGNDDHDHEYDDDPFLDQMAAKDKEIEDLKRRVIEVHRARAKVFLTLSSHWALTTG